MAVRRRPRSFTLIEVLIAIGITAILSAIIFVAVSGAIEKAQTTQATQNAEKLRDATELYFRDMGFYPPDTNRGADPGFTQSLPYYPDKEDPALYVDSHCPSGWQSIVANQWKGPYLAKWPTETPWGGKYDYNYWGSGGGRYGCTVPPGIYMGIQRDYDNQNPIPSSVEQKLLDLGYDADGCLNGEAQLLLIKL